MRSPEITPSLVTFSNQPTLSDEPSQTERNEKRIGLVPSISTYLNNTDLFKSKPTTVEFVSSGMGSLVCFVATTDSKYVLKIPLGQYGCGGGQFLNAWAAQGVKVPEIIETGYIDEEEFILMRHIDAETLNMTHTPDNLMKEKIPFAMGDTMRKMHTTKSHGFGKITENNGVGTFESFANWLDSDDVQRSIKQNSTHQYSSARFAPFEQVRNILVSHIGPNTETSFCHDDFGTHNIFNTEPITVFDPNPQFNHGLVDVGRSLMINIAGQMPEEANKQFLEGYFESQSYDPIVIHAAIALSCYFKLPFWHTMTNATQKRIDRLGEYLEKNQQLLQT